MPARHSSANLTKLRALIVEDNEHMRKLLRILLGAIGITQVYESLDGQEALENLTQYKPDFVLSDLSMVPMDGLAFVRAIRQRPSHREALLPVIMVTGHTERKRVEAARDAGVTEILAKPLTTAGLLHRIEQIIMRPRAFVRCDHYFGPDRRRRADPDYLGPWRRADDAEIDLDQMARPGKRAGSRH